VRRSSRASAFAALCFLTACSPSERETSITIIGTTDVHGYLLPYDYATDEPIQHSLAQVATLIDSVRRANPNVILVDSGDLLQGTALNEYQVRVGMESVHPVISAMNRLAYDAAVLGNHEFNFGVPFLEKALASAEVPFLAANIYVSGTEDLRFPAYRIVERGGLRVGILGLTTPGVMIWDEANIEGLLRFEDIVESTRRWLPELVKEEPDVVVVVAHSGLGPGSSYDQGAGVPEENALARLAVEVPGIDVIFAGHTGSTLSGERVGGTLIVQAGVHADHIAVAELTVRRSAAGTEVVSDGLTITTEGVRPHPDIVALATPAHENALTWLREPIGYTPDSWSAATARLEDTPIADLIARVQLEVTGAEVSAAAIFRTDAGFGPGPITRRDILGLYTYPNTLRAVRISGADLRAFLERSAEYYRTLPADDLINPTVRGYNFDLLEGAEYVLDLTRPVGFRVSRLTRNGRPVTDQDSLTLALNNYRQAGGGGFDMVSRAPIVYRDEIDISTRIIDYVRGIDTLRIDGVYRSNWELRPPSAVTRLRATARANDSGSR
jgi:2',3'-cyclic-nucleotide 2'-phosphodiesterase (5'-nucleotidase family)